MQRMLVGGYRLDEPMDCPNLWRVFAGDRLAWVGPPRGGVESVDGVLAVVEFRENALVCELFSQHDGPITKMMPVLLNQVI